MILGRIRLFLVCAILLAAITGCRSTDAKPEPPPETNAGRARWGANLDPKKNLQPGIDFAVVQYVTWEDRVAFALWTDLGVPDGFANELSSYLQPNRAGGEGRYSGALQEKQNPTGPVIEFNCVTTDGRNGKVKVGAESFELANGYFVLVSTIGAKIRTKQFQRDTINVPPASRPVDVVNGMDQLKMDADIVAFFAR